MRKRTGGGGEEQRGRGINRGGGGGRTRGGQRGGGGGGDGLHTLICNGSAGCGGAADTDHHWISRREKAQSQVCTHCRQCTL